MIQKESNDHDFASLRPLEMNGFRQYRRVQNHILHGLDGTFPEVENMDAEKREDDSGLPSIIQRVGDSEAETCANKTVRSKAERRIKRKH
jgi:hypothetical protein